MTPGTREKALPPLSKSVRLALLAPSDFVERRCLADQGTICCPSLGLDVCGLCRTPTSHRSSRRKVVNVLKQVRMQNQARWTGKLVAVAAAALLVSPVALAQDA